MQSNVKLSTKIRRLEEEILILKIELLKRDEEIFKLKSNRLELGCNICSRLVGCQECPDVGNDQSDSDNEIASKLINSL